MQKYIVISVIVGFLLFKIYGPDVTNLLGSSDDLDSTFFGKTVTIQGPSGYCGVRSKEVPIVSCQYQQVTDSQLFDITKTAECSKRPDGKTECQFAFRNKLSGKVCADEGNRIICTRNVPGPWEKFAFIKQPGFREFSFPGARSGTARKACQDKGAGGIVCDGGREAFGPASIFKWSLPNETQTPVPASSPSPTPPTP